MHLHQNYSHALIILFRSPLVIVARQRLSQASVPQEALTEPDPQALRLSTECSTAAQDMIANFDRVRQAKLMARFSWTDFQGCSTAILVILFYRVIEQNLDYERTIDTGLHILKVLAEASKPAQLALNFVQEFKKIVEEAVQRSQQPEKVSDVANVQRQSYESWLSSLSVQKASVVRENTERQTSAISEIWSGLPEEVDEPISTELSGAFASWAGGRDTHPLPEMSLDSDILFDESQILSLSGMDFLANSVFLGDHLV